MGIEGSAVEALAGVDVPSSGTPPSNDDPQEIQNWALGGDSVEQEGQTLPSGVAHDMQNFASLGLSP